MPHETLGISTESMVPAQCDTVFVCAIYPFYKLTQIYPVKFQYRCYHFSPGHELQMAMDMQFEIEQASKPWSKPKLLRANIFKNQCKNTIRIL